MKQFHRIGELDLKQIIDQCHDKDHQEKGKGIHQCVCRNFKVHPDIIIQDLQQDEIHKLTEYAPE